jgi:uncharacterized protein (DUF885 family)
MRNIVTLAILVVLPAFCQPGTNAELHKLFREYYETGLRESPEAATYAGRNEYNNRWTDWSPKGLASLLAGNRDIQNRLQAFRTANLNEQDRLSVELLDYELRTWIEELDRMRNYIVVNHFIGPHLAVGSIMAMAPATTVKDYEDRIARLRAIPAHIDGMISAADEARGKGMVPPKVVVDRLLTQLHAQRTPAAVRVLCWRRSEICR